ncbi:hypothetical protein [uncultured Bacteroides sp.]|uniref:hypothetical protein n=1 Tax=uncultured Bacteroides sp. TaxID=162156 RepID=UPI002AAB747F|nr:hypothetical protein [uncultured Bacteroides sp.]
MHNLDVILTKFLDICKMFSTNLVDEEKANIKLEITQKQTKELFTGITGRINAVTILQYINKQD